MGWVRWVYFGRVSFYVAHTTLLETRVLVPFVDVCRVHTPFFIALT
jgi:hypothetical protein